MKKLDKDLEKSKVENEKLSEKLSEKETRERTENEKSGNEQDVSFDALNAHKSYMEDRIKVS